LHCENEESNTRGLSFFILGKIIATTAYFGSIKISVTSNFLENCMILKRNSIWKEAFYRPLLYKDSIQWIVFVSVESIPYFK
jgi:hypothetical protein